MKNRILYIDNLKAFAIFTVIVGHVFYFTWNHYSNNVWNYLIAAYNMPLFFFLSGMFAKDKMSFYQLIRKAKQLLLPTITLGGVYAFINDGISELLFGGSHFGYWFLPTLFIMFAVFYLRCLLMAFLRDKMRLGERIILIADVSYMFACWGIIKTLVNYMPENIYNLFCLGNIANYILFFWLGFLSWHNKKRLANLIKANKDKIYALCFILFSVLFYYGFYISSDFRGYQHKILALLSIPVLILLFRQCDFGKGKIQTMLSYVGTHSLEIYVLQYFFLPSSYKLVSSISGGVNCLAISLIESILTLLLCVVAVKVISVNKYLNLLFFGK